MKILYLYNHRLFMGVENTVSLISNLANVPGIEFYIYGPYHTISMNYSSPEKKGRIEPLSYNENITAIDLYKTFKPDLILMSFKEELDYWLPKDLYKLDVPKIIIEADYQMHIDADDWYKKNVDLMVMMSYFDKTPVESIWWPFSVRNDVVERLDINRKRKEKIFFMGSLGVDWYSIRKNALERLLATKLAAYYNHRVPLDVYISKMCEYTGMLTCSSTFHTPLAKMFEGMLTKTAVLTNWFKGAGFLFDYNKCFFEYKDDCSDVVTVAKELLYNSNLREHYVNIAYDIVKNNHTASHRIAELYNIITVFVNNGKIIRKWRH